MKKISLLNFIFLFALSINAQTWTKLSHSFIYPSTTDKGKVFASHNNILLAGLTTKNGPIHISMDGGSTWSKVPLIDKVLVAAEYSPNGNIYLITGKRQTTSVITMDSLFSSTNGTTWTNLGKIPYGQIPSTAGRDEGDYVISKNNTLLFPHNVGAGVPYLSQSTNNGSSWTNTAYSGSITSVACSPTIDTIVLGTYNAGVKYSHDGGSTFNNCNTSFGSVTVGGMFYRNNGDIFSATLGTLYKSTDGGQNFTALVPNPLITFQIHELDYSIGVNKFYIKAVQNIYETADGISYTSILGNLPDIAKLHDIAVSNDNIYAVTDSSIYKLGISASTGISENNFNTLQINTYPNPSSGIVYVSSSEKLSTITFEVTDILGATVYKAANIANNQLDLSHLSNGTYFIRALSDGGAISKKIIIQK